MKAIAGVEDDKDGGLVSNEKPFVCPSDGHFGDPSDCTKFYKCSPGWDPVVESCVGTMRYNQNTLMCDWPDNVTC